MGSHFSEDKRHGLGGVVQDENDKEAPSLPPKWGEPNGPALSRCPCRGYRVGSRVGLPLQLKLQERVARGIQSHSARHPHGAWWWSRAQCLRRAKCPSGHSSSLSSLQMLGRFPKRDLFGSRAPASLWVTDGSQNQLPAAGRTQ